MLRVFFAAMVIITAALCFQSAPDGDWPAYGRDPGGQRFSPLTTINRNNVRGLQVGKHPMNPSGDRSHEA
jgi:glucose dehydrogenase